MYVNRKTDGMGWQCRHMKGGPLIRPIEVGMLPGVALCRFRFVAEGFVFFVRKTHAGRSDFVFFVWRGLTFPTRSHVSQHFCLLWTCFFFQMSMLVSCAWMRLCVGGGVWVEGPFSPLSLYTTHRATSPEACWHADCAFMMEFGLTIILCAV